MLNIAKNKGLKCFPIDALDYLKDKEDGTIGGIFSSQVIEHFTPEYLRKVVTVKHLRNFILKDKFTKKTVHS